MILCGRILGTEETSVHVLRYEPARDEDYIASLGGHPFSPQDLEGMWLSFIETWKGRQREVSKTFPLSCNIASENKADMSMLGPGSGAVSAILP